jgi:hypothetical protein
VVQVAGIGMRRMVISEATVKTHLLHIYAKLGVNDRAAAVAAAFERGLIKPRQPIKITRPIRNEEAPAAEPHIA